MNEASIGVFDSGFGGLTVMNAITSRLPYENIAYFADTANLPYGNKSPEAIIEYSFQAIQFLAKQGIKLLVVACHTSCVTSLSIIQKHFSFPIIGVADAGIKDIVSQEKKQHLAFLGTQRTVASQVYQKAIETKLPGSKVTGIACPLFVPLVEMGYVDNPLITEAVIEEYLKPLKEDPIPVDALLLACTHYPLLRKPIEESLGKQTIIIDPAISCAKEVEELLVRNNLQRAPSPPKHQFYVSDNPERFQTNGKLFFASPIESIVCVRSSSFV